MTLAAAITNHYTTANQALTGAGTIPKTASTTSASSSSDSSSSSASIGSSDFLTLLVTELRNQDPTANADPNEYVNQLVAVNSLEQLININSTLTTNLGTSTTSSASGAAASSGAGLTGNSATGAPAQALDAQQMSGSAVASGADPISSAIQMATSKLSHGNLSVPDVNPAAQTVAQALSGRRHSM